MKRTLALVLGLMLLSALLGGCSRVSTGSQEAAAAAAEPTAAPVIESAVLPVVFAESFVESSSGILYESGENYIFACVTLANAGDYGASAADRGCIMSADGATLGVSLSVQQNGDGSITWCVSLPLDKQDGELYFVVQSRYFLLSTDAASAEAGASASAFMPVVEIVDHYNDYSPSDGNVFALIHIDDPSQYGLSDGKGSEVILEDGTRVTATISSFSKNADGALDYIEMVYILADAQQTSILQLAIEEQVLDVVYAD